MAAAIDNSGFGRRKPKAEVAADVVPQEPAIVPEYKPTDAGLRAFGFRIHSRPAVGEPTWKRGRRVYGQAEAHVIAKAESGSL